MYMSTTVSVSEARATLPELLDRVLAGEEITITRHGAAVAVVIRPDRLRVRRAERMFSEAEELRRQVEEARKLPLGRGRLSKARADELVRELRADRSR
jgi:prevent-host-death family protein